MSLVTFDPTQETRAEIDSTEHGEVDSQLLHEQNGWPSDRPTHDGDQANPTRRSATSISTIVEDGKGKLSLNRSDIPLRYG
jgi:hypothetical protein